MFDEPKTCHGSGDMLLDLETVSKRDVDTKII